MNSLLFNDSRATGLLNRVREDVSLLRGDMGNLLSHTARQTLPNGARVLADQAKHRIADSGAYAASRLRDFSANPTTRQSAGWIGGALLVGLLAAGAYVFTHNGRHSPMTAASGKCEPDNEATC